jgi:hypothetical protein
MLDLWGPVNRRSSMIVMIGQYPTIPLEMSIGIVYGPPMDNPACGIAVTPHVTEFLITIIIALIMHEIL